jgi:phage terminase small subunit
MTPKQERFVAEYLVDCNATQAAIRAGYSAKTAESKGAHLVKDSQVSAAIAERKAKIEDKLGLDAEWVRSRLMTVAERCLQEIEPVYAGRGEKRQPTGEYVFDASGANKALELLGKDRDIGLFADRLEVKQEITRECVRQLVDNQTQAVREVLTAELGDERAQQLAAMIQARLEAIVRGES